MKKISLFLLLAAVSCGLNDSSPAGRRAEALPDAAWEESVWISAADAPVVDHVVTDRDFRSADGASWFFSQLVNEAKVVSAKWMTTGLGIYELYVNGRPVGEEVLKPGFTHAGKTKYSYTYDITDAIVRGKGAENQFSVQVTPGWWADKIVTPGKHAGMVGRKCAFRGVVELTFGDGSKKYYGTDLAHWKAGVTGPVLHAGIFDGETYDARELPGYVNWGVLTTPEENTEFSGEILPSAGAEIYFRPDLALAPVAAYSWRDIEGADEENYGKVVKIKDFAKGEAMRLHPGETLVVDFGQNAAAVPSFVFQAEEGTNLCCLPAEMLNDGNGAKSRGMDGPEGSVHRLNLRIPEEGLRLDYTFGPEDKAVSYTPRCTFFGYRYISVTATADVTIRSVVSIPVTSITKSLETGTVKTGDADVNKLSSNTLWGQRSNYLSVPTDCPQRNERLGWMADTQVFTETGTFFANTDAFFRKWMRDVRDSQNEKGGLPGVAPTAQYGDAMMRLGWADAGVIVPWTVWKQFGDRAIIEENWAMMERFMDHIAETEYDHEALREENGNYQWADWLSYEALESHDKSAFTKDAAGKRTPTPETLAYWNYLSCCYWILDAGMMRDMAAATGRDTAKYEAMAEAARSRIRASYLDGEGTFTPDTLNTMQTPALFALKCGLVEGAAKEALCARLRANFAAHENCLQTGFLGTSILMDVLTENGMADIAMDLLFQHKNPSWLYSVDNGATTIWERWNSYTIESGMGPKGMNSFNHYAYGCVCAWIWKSVAGIAADPAQPGFRHIVMAPVPDRRLGSVEAEYASAAGKIRSAWRFDGDRWTWTFSIPEGASATVTLPGETVSKDYAPGTYTVKKDL